LDKFRILKYIEKLPILSSDDKIYQDKFMCYTLSAPSSFWDAPQDYIKDFTNGCGTEGFCDIFVPDHFYFLNIVAACKIHDWCFIVWNDKEGFDLANKLFLNNLQRICKQHFNKTGKNFINRFLLRRRLNLCKIYYKAVDVFGEQPYLDSHIDLYEAYKNM
jgi:hypothetical protein